MDQMERTEMSESRTMSMLNVLFGIWLVIAPYVLSYNKSAAYWNEVMTGIVVIVLGLARFVLPRVNSFSWLTGIAGIWLILSPFFFAYTSAAAYWNQIIFGILIAIVAYGNAGMLERRTHHAAH